MKIDRESIRRKMDPPKITVAPLRSLGDFLLDSARFQVPTFNDLQKWNNRVIQNLLYYQSNYFLTYLVIFILVSFIHPVEMCGGTIAVGIAAGFFSFLTKNQPAAFEFKKNHPFICTILILSCGYMLVCLVGSVLVFLNGILLPLAVIFIHSSMRLRSLKNKLLNKVEWLGLKRSPMGVILEFLGVEPEIAF